MFDALVWSFIALAAAGVAAAAVVLYREGHLGDVTLPRWLRVPRWLGEWADADAAHDVWPADVDHDFTHTDAYREDSR